MLCFLLSVGHVNSLASATKHIGDRVDFGNRIPYYDVGVAKLDHNEFSLICDARSEGEFLEDHFPSAISTPVLDNDERAMIGTLYKESSFAARRLGAAIVSKNIGEILMREEFLKLEKHDKVLVYCWRGGERSMALAHTMSRIGYEVTLLRRGYKSYRERILAEMKHLDRFNYHIISGKTGVGKGRLLDALAARGAQTVDLEIFAGHKGSVLGDTPNTKQPTQAMFESRIFLATRHFRTDRPVYIESESTRIGIREIPSSMCVKMSESTAMTVLTAPLSCRVAYIREGYQHFEQPGEGVEALKSRIAMIEKRRGRAKVDSWYELIDAGKWDEFVENMLIVHYDPGYTKSQERSFPPREDRQVVDVALESMDNDEYMRVAAMLLAREVNEGNMALEAPALEAPS